MLKVCEMSEESVEMSWRERYQELRGSGDEEEILDDDQKTGHLSNGHEVPNSSAEWSSPDSLCVLYEIDRKRLDKRDRLIIPIRDNI